jgi:hypothetical protein
MEQINNESRYGRVAETLWKAVVIFMITAILAMWADILFGQNQLISKPLAVQQIDGQVFHVHAAYTPRNEEVRVLLPAATWVLGTDVYARWEGALHAYIQADRDANMRLRLGTHFPFPDTDIVARPYIYSNDQSGHDVYLATDSQYREYYVAWKTTEWSFLTVNHPLRVCVASATLYEYCDEGQIVYIQDAETYKRPTSAFKPKVGY